MTESDLIDAINERAAVDAVFRRQLENAIAAQSIQAFRSLIGQLLQDLSVSEIGKRQADEAIRWFMDSE